MSESITSDDTEDDTAQQAPVPDGAGIDTPRSEQQGNEEGYWASLLHRFQTRRARYAEREELSWGSETAQLGNLFVTLRVRYEESRNAAIGDSRLGWLFSGIGIFAAVFSGFIAYVGWRKVFECATKEADIAHLWPKMASTSGAVILALGVATVILKVGDRFSQRSAVYLREANQTRGIEAAVRLAFMIAENERSKALKELIGRILENPTERSDSSLDVSAVPALVTEIKNVALEAIQTLQNVATPKEK